jgi:DNA-binding IclR family transcriptional regulator
MGTSSDRPYAEPMSMNEVETYLYEAIATLEYIGHPVTRTEIAAVADLDDSTVDRTLRDMTGHGFLVQGDYGGEPAYELANRDWRAAPDKASGRAL